MSVFQKKELQKTDSSQQVSSSHLWGYRNAQILWCRWNLTYEKKGYHTCDMFSKMKLLWSFRVVVRFVFEVVWVCFFSTFQCFVSVWVFLFLELSTKFFKTNQQLYPCQGFFQKKNSRNVFWFCWHLCSQMGLQWQGARVAKHLHDSVNSWGGVLHTVVEFPAPVSERDSEQVSEEASKGDPDWVSEGLSAPAKNLLQRLFEVPSRRPFKTSFQNPLKNIQQFFTTRSEPPQKPCSKTPSCGLPLLVSKGRL